MCDSCILSPCSLLASLAVKAMGIFPPNASLLILGRGRNAHKTNGLHWNNLVKMSEVDQCSFQTYVVIWLIDLWGYSFECLPKRGNEYTALRFQPCVHFWVSGKDSVGGSLTAVILKCLLSLETKTSNHSLSADAFYRSKKLNSFDAFLSNDKLLWESFTLRFTVLEWNTSCV